MLGMRLESEPLVLSLFILGWPVKLATLPAGWLA